MSVTIRWNLRSQYLGAGDRFQPNTHSPWLGQLMVSRQERARPLLTPVEVMQFSPDVGLVMVSGHPPVHARKLRYFEDRNFPTGEDSGNGRALPRNRLNRNFDRFHMRLAADSVIRCVAAAKSSRRTRFCCGRHTSVDDKGRESTDRWVTWAWPSQINSVPPLDASHNLRRTIRWDLASSLAPRSEMFVNRPIGVSCVRYGK
jgi:hypothetical protein